MDALGRRIETEAIEHFDASIMGQGNRVRKSGSQEIGVRAIAKSYSDPDFPFFESTRAERVRHAGMFAHAKNNREQVS